MIRHLPEGSRYTSLRRAEAELAEDTGEEFPEPEMSPLEERALELRTWDTTRQLHAMVINAIRENTLISGNWKKGKEPELQITGPSEWDPKRRKRSEVKKQVADGKVTTAQVLAAMGFQKG